ncbi:hypothetical protein ACQPZX_28560 [Actinoplanes sp. CA-142083]|uniref:hypothetical protein n=1 Tax=Actinoplanes sp. CA-142083 TaxID=3239903 RepID=UPI003D9295E7
MRFRLLAALAVLSLLAACGGEPELPPPAGGDQPILLIDEHPGFSPPASRWALPSFVLLGDGSAIIGDDDQGIAFTGKRRALTAGQVAELYRDADDAGLMRSRRHTEDVLDAGALVVRITTDKGTHETSVVAPDFGDGGARGRAIRFATEALRAGEPGGAYVPEKVAAVVVGEDEDTTDVRPWPLPTPAAQMPGYPGRPCLVLDGADAARLLRTALTATARTRWSSGEKTLSLRVRPLLPYEKTCDDL